MHHYNYVLVIFDKILQNIPEYLTNLYFESTAFQPSISVHFYSGALFE